MSTKISARYLRFAEEEARGKSPLYEALARGVAANQDALGLLAMLPEVKQQPNLLFAAVRRLCGVSPDWRHFRETLLANAEAVLAVMQTHATQTNEAARCATLLPVLAQLPQPIALIEVGASAGLCLLPDRYGYDYGGRVIRPAGGGGPVFACATCANTPIPGAVPHIVWRAGLDLRPVDPADPGQTAWLELLVWPEQTLRRDNLRAALTIAAACPPRVVAGDLLGNALPELCREAPRDVTLVVFHTAVLAYVDDLAARQAFAQRTQSLCDYWIANEAPGVFPEIARRTGAGLPGRFLLSVNGTPVAWTDPHGAAMEWIANATNSRFDRPGPV